METAFALQAYTVGLAGYAAIKVLTPCFIALGLPKTPLRIALIGIAINLALNTLNATVLGFGHVGLALTTSAVALLNFLQLMIALSRQVDLGGLRQWTLFLGRCAAAAGLCGAVAWGINHLAEAASGNGLIRALGLAAAIGASVPIYFIAARLLRLQESADAWRMIRRRLPGLAR